VYRERGEFVDITRARVYPKRPPKSENVTYFELEERAHGRVRKSYVVLIIIIVTRDRFRERRAYGADGW